MRPDRRPRTTPMRSASSRRLSFSCPLRSSAASARTFERNRENGTRNASANVVAAFAAKYHHGAGCGLMTSKSLAMPLSHTANSSAGNTAPSVASSHSPRPNSSRGIAAMAKNGSVPPAASLNRIAPAKMQRFAVPTSSRREARCAPRAFSASTPRKPVVKPISQGRALLSPNSASRAAQLAMMMVPPNANVLHSQMRFSARTDMPGDTPMCSPRSIARHAVARAAATARRSGLSHSRRGIQGDTAPRGRSCGSAWLELTIKTPVL